MGVNIVVAWRKVPLKCMLVFVDDVKIESDEKRTTANNKRTRNSLPGDGDQCCAT